MKSKLLLCIYLVLSFNCYANKITIKRDSSYTIDQAKKMALKGDIVTRRGIKGYRKAFDNCAFTNQHSVVDRLTNYPYATASKIIIVSYFGGPEPSPPIILDSVRTPPPRLTYKQRQRHKGLVITHTKLDYSTLIETKTLNRKQIEELTNIIFNYDFAGMKDYTVTGWAGCFDPRNSVIFFDKNGKIFDHLDICFHCHNYESASKKLDVGTNCKQKFDMLAKFFIKAGVRYGADEKVPLN